MQERGGKGEEEGGGAHLGGGEGDGGGAAAGGEGEGRGGDGAGDHGEGRHFCCARLTRRCVCSSPESSVEDRTQGGDDKVAGGCSGIGLWALGLGLILGLSRPNCY